MSKFDFNKVLLAYLKSVGRTDATEVTWFDDSQYVRAGYACSCGPEYEVENEVTITYFDSKGQKHWYSESVKFVDFIRALDKIEVE